MTTKSKTNMIHTAVSNFPSPHLCGIVWWLMGSIEVLFPNESMSISLLSIEDIPTLIHRNKYHINNMMRYMDWLRKRKISIWHHWTGKKLYCEDRTMMRQIEWCTRIKHHFKCSIALHRAGNTIIDILHHFVSSITLTVYVRIFLCTKIFFINHWR